MATVNIITDSASILPRPPTPKVPIGTITSAVTRMSMINGPYTFACPIAPREIVYDGFEFDWQDQTRPGRKSLGVNRAPKLRHMSFTLLIAYPNRLTLIQPSIDRLRVVCQSSLPVTIKYDAMTGACTWRCVAMAVTVIERHPTTNAPTRASVELEFNEFVKPV